MTTRNFDLCVCVCVCLCVFVCVCVCLCVFVCVCVCTSKNILPPLQLILLCSTLNILIFIHAHSTVPPPPLFSGLVCNYCTTNKGLVLDRDPGHTSSRDSSFRVPYPPNLAHIHIFHTQKTSYVSKNKQESFWSFVYSRLQKVLQQASWTVKNHNWFTVFESRGRACWGRKDNQIHIL